MIRPISAEQLCMKLEQAEHLYLIELATEAEFVSGHLPRAVFWPRDSETDRHALALFPNTGRECVIYGQSGVDSAALQTLAGALDRLGYSGVYVYSGGKEDWKRAGLPLDRVHVPPPAPQPPARAIERATEATPNKSADEKAAMGLSGALR